MVPATWWRLETAPELCWTVIMTRFKSPHRSTCRVAVGERRQYDLVTCGGANSGARRRELVLLLANCTCEPKMTFVAGHNDATTLGRSLPLHLFTSAYSIKSALPPSPSSSQSHPHIRINPLPNNIKPTHQNQSTCLTLCEYLASFLELHAKLIFPQPSIHW